MTILILISPWVIWEECSVDISGSSNLLSMSLVRYEPLMSEICLTYLDFNGTVKVELIIESIIVITDGADEPESEICIP